MAHGSLLFFRMVLSACIRSRSCRSGLVGLLAKGTIQQFFGKLHALRFGESLPVKAFFLAILALFAAVASSSVVVATILFAGRQFGAFPSAADPISTLVFVFSVWIVTLAGSALVGVLATAIDANHPLLHLAVFGLLCLVALGTLSFRANDPLIYRVGIERNKCLSRLEDHHRNLTGGARLVVFVRRVHRGESRPEPLLL